jgi:hypothetical protein
MPQAPQSRAGAAVLDECFPADGRTEDGGQPAR